MLSSLPLLLRELIEAADLLNFTSEAFRFLVTEVFCCFVSVVFCFLVSVDFCCLGTEVFCCLVTEVFRCLASAHFGLLVLPSDFFLDVAVTDSSALEEAAAAGGGVERSPLLHLVGEASRRDGELPIEFVLFNAAPSINSKTSRSMNL